MGRAVQRHHDEVLDALVAVASNTGIPAELCGPTARRVTGTSAKGFSLTTATDDSMLGT